MVERGMDQSGRRRQVDRHAELPVQEGRPDRYRGLGPRPPEQRYLIAGIEQVTGDEPPNRPRGPGDQDAHGPSSLARSAGMPIPVK